MKHNTYSVIMFMTGWICLAAFLFMNHFIWFCILLILTAVIGYDAK